MNKCTHCNLEKTPEGHDGCLGTLHGLMNACCNHGGTYEGAFVQFLDGSIVNGEDAVIIQEILMKNRIRITINRNCYFMHNGEQIGITKINKILNSK